MLTPMLEKAILNGWATFRIHNHAFSNFGRIIIPDNSTVIITHVKWHPFFNPVPDFDDIRELTYRKFFKYNEFQLKIDAKQSKNYLIFRNEFDFQWTNPVTFNLDDIIDKDVIKNSLLIMQRRPITTHVYFKCQEYIKLTLQRNSYIDKFTPVTGALNPSTDEYDAPIGLQGQNILLNTQMYTPNGGYMYYFPNSLQDSSVVNAPDPQTMEANYIQNFAGKDSTFSKLSIKQQTYQTQPLVEIGYVVINSNKFDYLQNI